MQSILPGICLYTVRQSYQNDPMDTLQLLSAVGYRAVELYGACDARDPEVVRSALRNSDLAPVAWHMPLGELSGEGVIDALHACACDTLVVSTLFGERRMPTRDEWQAKLDELNGQSARLMREGIRLGCHTSAFAFSACGDESYYELMLRRLSGDMLIELDTGNCYQGKYDPCLAIAQCSSHPLYLHMKPYSQRQRYNVILGEESDVCDWRAILAAGDGRVEQWLVEGACNNLQELHVACLSLEHLRRLQAQTA